MRNLTLADHLEELRRRLGVSLLALITTSALSLVFVERLIAWLQRSAAWWLPRFAYFTPTEPLIAYAKVALLAGIMLAMPLILWQGWAFVRPALKPRERSAGRLFVLWGTAQFLAGAALAYYVLLPLSLRVLLGIGAPRLLPVISIDRYLGFVTTLVFWTGIIFELPVVIVLLARVGVVTPEWLRQQRPYAILVLVILAALLTPTTDPLTLLLVAVPLTGLYELSLLLARLVRPHQSARSTA